MRALIQRVTSASVRVDEQLVGEIAQGLLVFVGIRVGDTANDACRLATKVLQLRVFDDNAGTPNLSVQDIGGSLLVISQFTLYGETRRGNRPSYTQSAKAGDAEPIYHDFVRFCTQSDLKVSTGIFRADMQVTLTNDGPVTLLCSTDKCAIE